VSTHISAIVGVHIRGTDNHVGYAIPIQEALDFLQVVLEGDAKLQNSLDEPTNPPTAEELAVEIKRVVAAEEAVAKTLSEMYSLTITQQQVELALAETLRCSSTDLLWSQIDAPGMLRLLQAFNFAALFPQEIAFVELTESAIPPNTWQKLEEKKIKAGGEIWHIHLNDEDPRPSNPHGHNYEAGLKLDLSSGDLYHGTKWVNRMDRKRLVEIRTKAGNIQLPALRI